MPIFTAPGSPAYYRITLALFLAGFVTFSLLYCVQPLLPLLAQTFDATPAESSLVLSSSTVALALAILMAGPYSEWVGRRGLMAVSMAVASLCDIGAAFATDWHLLLVLRAMEGYALGGVPAVAMAYLAEEIEPRGLGFAMGLYVGGTALGGMAGRVLSGLISDAYGWRAAVGGIGLSGLVVALAFLLLLPPSRNFVAKPGFRPIYHFGAWFRHLMRPGLKALFVIGGLVMGAFVTVFNYVGFVLLAPPYSLSQSAIGLIFIVFLAGLVSSAVAGALSDRLGRLPVLLASLVLLLAGLLLALLPPLPLMIAGLTLVAAGFFASHAVASGWVGSLAAGDKGHATSLYLLTYYVGASLMGSAGGWFLTAQGWPGVILFCVAAMALAFAVTARLRAVSG